MQIQPILGFFWAIFGLYCVLWRSGLHWYAGNWKSCNVRRIFSVKAIFETRESRPKFISSTREQNFQKCPALIPSHVKLSCKLYEQILVSRWLIHGSVASPFCQEGQSERTFPIFPFFSWFCPSFVRFYFLLLFSNFWQVLRCQGGPPVATPLDWLFILWFITSKYDGRGT